VVSKRFLVLILIREILTLLTILLLEVFTTFVGSQQSSAAISSLLAAMSFLPLSKKGFFAASSLMRPS